jgi:hypothetical protein
MVQTAHLPTLTIEAVGRGYGPCRSPMSHLRTASRSNDSSLGRTGKGEPELALSVWRAAKDGGE